MQFYTILDVVLLCLFLNKKYITTVCFFCIIEKPKSCRFQRPIAGIFKDNLSIYNVHICLNF